jgi:hypothetical protein
MWCGVVDSGMWCGVRVRGMWCGVGVRSPVEANPHSSGVGNPKSATLNPQPPTPNTRHSPLNPKTATINPQPSIDQLS